MKSFKQFLAEQPTNNIGNGGYTNTADASGPVAGADPRLFPADIDDLSQDYQTPAEPGEAKWRFSNVYPVMKLSLSKSSDGPSIDSMVAASKIRTVGTTGAFFPPVLTTTQRDALSVTEGAMIFNTTTKKLEFYDGTSWQSLPGMSLGLTVALDG